MVIDSHNTEWGYELIATVPYAYAIHLRGELSGTVSGTGSEAAYFFSPSHRINPMQRDFAHTAEAAKSIPNMWIHKPLLDKTNWVPPPFREHYGKRAITFDKPTVVIYNRVNVEWSRGVINYFDLPTLRAMFDMLCPKYTVVYVNIRGQEALEDNAHSIELGDYEMIRSEYPQVKIIHDVVRDNGGDFNEVQMRVFAGCERFVTMNGGGSILASYFGGENIIYTVECKELRPTVNSFYNWYPDFGGSIIKVVHSYDDLLEMIRVKWVYEKPLINILVRFHRREKPAKRLMESIKKQSYKNWNIIGSYDDNETFNLICGLPCQKVRVRPPAKTTKPDGDEYRGWLGANSYLNDLQGHVKKGYVTFIDDDDYYEDGALELIAAHASPSTLLLWQAVDRSGNLVPSKENEGKIVAGDVSGIAFAVHHSHKMNWEPWRRGDYRVIRDLSKTLPVSFLPMPLSVMGKRLEDMTPEEKAIARKEYVRMRAAQVNEIVRKRMQMKRGGA